MLKLLSMVRAIGRALGITRAVGHVPPTQDSPTGGNNNTAVSKPQRAKRESKAKLSAVQQDKQAQSSKTETSSVPTRTKKSSTSGTPQATPASPAVKQKRRRKPSAASLITQDKLSKQIQKVAQAEHGQDGSQAATPALPIRLPVKPAVKAKAVRVPSIKAALLSQLERVPALTLTEAQSGEPGQHKTVASKTRLPALQVKTKKQKAAASTTRVKKDTPSKTAAPTRTVRQSKARGS